MGSHDVRVNMGKISESLGIWERWKRHNNMRRQIKKMKLQNFLEGVCLASHIEVRPWKCQEDMVFASQMIVHVPLGKTANLFAVGTLGWLVFRWEDRVLFTYLKFETRPDRQLCGGVDWLMSKISGLYNPGAILASTPLETWLCS